MPVAIKTLLPHTTGVKEEEKFLHEARVQKTFEDDERILTVVEVLQYDSDKWAIITPFMDGGSLERVDVLSEPEAANIVLQVCYGLSRIHSDGKVHCDIKPANILRDAQGAVVIADFGLCLDKDQFGSPRDVAGTPEYMSPEQLNPESLIADSATGQIQDSSRPDRRSDIYSLGVVLIKLTTGRLPYITDPKRHSYNQLLNEIATGTATHDEWRSGISNKLLEVCQKATRRDPENRFQTSQEFADALRPFIVVDNQPFSIAPLSADAFSYVKRQCDDELAELLQDGNSAVMICGPPQTGKTSLSRQCSHILDDSWTLVELQPPLLRPDNPKRFMSEFFKAVSIAYGHDNEVSDFTNLAYIVKTKPCAILLDELGTLTLECLEMLFAGFVQLFLTVTEFGVVVCIGIRRRKRK